MEPYLLVSHTTKRHCTEYFLNVWTACAVRSIHELCRTGPDIRSSVYSFNTALMWSSAVYMAVTLGTELLSNSAVYIAVTLGTELLSNSAVYIAITLGTVEQRSLHSRNTWH